MQENKPQMTKAEALPDGGHQSLEGVQGDLGGGHPEKEKYRAPQCRSRRGYSLISLRKGLKEGEAPGPEVR